MPTGGSLHLNTNLLCFVLFVCGDGEVREMLGHTQWCSGTTPGSVSKIPPPQEVCERPPVIFRIKPLSASFKVAS